MLESPRIGGIKAAFRIRELSRSLLNLSPAPFFVENLNQHRSNNVSLVNVRVDKLFQIGKARITAMFDVDNVLNANPVTNFNLFNDDYGHVIAVLDPRVALIGVRLTF